MLTEASDFEGLVIAVYDAGPPPLLILDHGLDIEARMIIEMLVTRNPPKQAVSVFIDNFKILQQGMIRK